MAKTYKINSWEPPKAISHGQTMWWTVEFTPSSEQERSDPRREYSGYCSGNPYLIAAADWPTVYDPKPRGFPVGPRGKLAARCVFISFAGDVARCDVEVEGAWLSVAFDAHLLRRHNLRPGDKFLWWMAEDGTVSLEDIDPELSQTPSLTFAEETAYRELWADFQKRLQTGEVWEEYTEDGI